MSVKNDFDGFFREAKVSKKKKFVINCEFEIFGERLDNVITSCPQLNIHTVDHSIQGATGKLAEAIKFFFDTAEARHQLEHVIDELEKGSLEVPPWAAKG